MNLILALLVLLGTTNEPSEGSRQWSGQVFYYDGRTLTQLNTILMPNVGHATLTLFVNSPSELHSARIDSSEAEICLLKTGLMKELKLRGRWYMISWKTDLKVGAAQHTLNITTFSGRTHKKTFSVNVEGSKKQGKPQGVNK